MFDRFKEEEGFTLIELLVVVLIIGILAAIALPTFLGQQKKAQDSSAKSDARSALSAIESCYADTQDYQSCDTAAELSTSGNSLGNTTGVALTAATTDVMFPTITVRSKSGAFDFIISKSATTGAYTRTCTTGAKGCTGTSW